MAAANLKRALLWLPAVRDGMASPRSEHISRRRTDDLAERFLSRGAGLPAFQPIVAASSRRSR
jgi:hypothetical protein